MGYRTDIALLIICGLVVIGVVVGIIYLIVYYEKYGHLACKEEEDALVWDGIKLKVCNDHEFVRTTFNREEICCKLHLNKNCFDSFKMNDELEESCAVLNNYKAFLKVCLYRIGLVDFFDIIKPYLVKLSDGCRTNSKYPFVSLEGDD